MHQSQADKLRFTSLLCIGLSKLRKHQEERNEKGGTVIKIWKHHNNETSLCFLSNAFLHDCKPDIANKYSLKRKTKQRSKKSITAGNKFSFLMTK